MSGLFEHLAATDDSLIIAHRKATAVANKRVKDRFGAFLANADNDFSARLALVEEDITDIVTDVVGEYGGDAQKIEAAIKKSFGPVPAPMGASPMGAPPMGGQTAPGSDVCPQCGKPLSQCQCQTGNAGGSGGAPGYNGAMPAIPSSGKPQLASVQAAGGFCDECHNWKSGPKAGCTCGDGDNDGDDKDESEPDTRRDASSRVARRPKLCPYHSEVVDISLGAGDAQAGYNAMAAHAWGEQHCKGAYGGNCNFRPAMVSQQYWDDKQNEYAERREQRELERQQNVDHGPDLSIDTEPIMDPEPLQVEPGKEGVSDIDGELANAPSAVGAGEMAMAASTHKEAEALKTVDLPTGDESALGGPSPKIDKGKSGDQGGWSLAPIDTQMDGSPHPTEDQDPTDKADYNKDDFLDQTRATTTTETLPTNSGDAGYDTERNIKLQPTKTWSGESGQQDPVTNTALSSHHGARDPVDPDKNPIAEILDTYEGWLMPNQVESALRNWPRG